MRVSLHPAAVLFVIVVVIACGGSPALTGNAGAGTSTPGSTRASAAPTVPGTRPSPVTSSVPTGGGTPLPTGAGTPGPSSPPQPSTGATTPGGSAGATTPFHAAADLERVVPTQAGGLPLAVESVSGAGFSDASGKHNAGLRCRWYEGRGLRCRDQKMLGVALAALGRSAQDVTIAVGYNETKDKEIEVQATRVAGVNGAQIRDAVLAAMRDAAAKQKGTLKTSEATVGGKSVTVITYASPYPLGLRRYLYASGDALFDIRRAYDTPAAEILQALP